MLDVLLEDLLVCLHLRQNILVSRQVILFGIHLQLYRPPCLHEALALTLQSSDSLLQFRLVKQIGVARQDSHVLREIHARFLVHASLVDGTRSHCARLQLRDEHLLVVEQIELIGIQCTLYSVNMHIHLVPCKHLGNLIAFSDRTTIALFKVAWSPGTIEMMNRHSPFLGVYASTQHRCGAEQNSHTSFVHGSDDGLPCLLVLALLYEAYLVGRDAVVLHQFPLDFGIDRPSATGLIRS